jgi:Carboxymuconolactone decarboxylase family.
MSRIPLPRPEDMSLEQRRVYDAIVSGPRGRLVGPLRAAIHNPELAERWQKLGEILRFGTSLPPKLNELAIIVTARRWNSQIEWYIHAEAARQAGLAQAVLDAIRSGDTPEFAEEGEHIVYEFARQLQEHGTVSDPIYDRAVALWGPTGVVELTAVVGYYTLVSMTLNVHHIPMPDDAKPPLDTPMRGGAPILTAMPPAHNWNPEHD